MLKTIAQYTIVHQLGKGGMDTVYEAEERLSKRRVALKVLRDDIQSTFTGGCDVVLQTVPKATWAADRLTVSRHEDSILSALVRYVRGGDAGLVQRQELRRVLRNFASISERVFLKKDNER